MRKICAKCVYVVILQFILVASALANTLTFSEQGDIFAETDRYQVQFRKGSIIHVHNKLTKEIYTVSGRRDAELSGMRGPRFDEWEIDGEDYADVAPEWEIGGADALKVEKISPLAVKLTARWKQMTLLMWVVIDVRTGDLIIRQEGFSEQTGISTIGWGIGNLDYNLVSPIVPAHGGKIMNEQHTTNAYWTYPHLWQAPLAVVQGTLGGCFVMSEDETDQFKAFGQWPERKKPNFFAIAFDTHNLFPFEDRQHITSAIWRFNTYRGDWQVPAETYRQAMMERNESRLARRPAWVKDIQLVIMYCSLNRNYIRMLDFLAQQINPKNVLIYCRGGWKHELFGSFASQAKARGFRVMVFAGFQSVAPDHPRYAEWEPFLYRSSDGHILGWNFDQGGPAFVNPAASSYRKFHVQTLKNVQETYNIDAIHLDLNYFIGNHAPIDGLTPIQGNMLLHEDLIEAMPDIVLSGEAIHAVTSPYLAFYGTGDNVGYGDPHPISDFFFSQWSPAYSGTFAYLTQRNVQPAYKYDPEAVEANIQEREILNAHIKVYKQLDVVPTIRYYFESHFAVYQAISILHRTNSNVEFWEELGKMVNTYREDINLDGVVNVLDLVIVAGAFGKEQPDLNGDDVVNILDLVIVANALN